MSTQSSKTFLVPEGWTMTEHKDQFGWTYLEMFSHNGRVKHVIGTKDDPGSPDASWHYANIIDGEDTNEWLEDDISLETALGLPCFIVGDPTKWNPRRTTINGKPAPWTKEIFELWYSKGPSFKPGEWCSSANYFTPRPWRNEYDTGSKEEGFVYTVQPGDHVCVKEWIPQ